MTALLTPADYETIRKAIDVDLDDVKLPDNVISKSIYERAAINDVLELHPTAEAETGNNLWRVKNAAIFFCAARLCPVVVRITSLTIQARDLNYSKPVFDPATRAAELRGLANQEISEVLTPTEAAARPTMFARAPGYRGR